MNDLKPRAIGAGELGERYIAYPTAPVTELQLTVMELDDALADIDEGLANWVPATKAL